jgi:hypothetical protein
MSTSITRSGTGLPGLTPLDPISFRIQCFANILMACSTGTGLVTAFAFEPSEALTVDDEDSLRR